MTALHSEVSVGGRLSTVSGAEQERASVRDVVGAYVGLTKPRVIELLLLTTVPVMFFAEARRALAVAGGLDGAGRDPLGRERQRAQLRLRP